MKVLALIIILCGVTVSSATECSDLGGRCISRPFGNCDRNEKEIGNAIRNYCSNPLKTCCLPKETQSTKTTTEATITVHDCGKTQHEVSKLRIVGGETAPRGAWPWQISLQFKGRHICGGSLINNLWVVTAAHCFAQSTYPLNYKIKVGAHQFGKTDGVNYDVSKIILSDKWKGIVSNVVGDLALMKLSKPVENMPSEFVNPICIPEKADEAAAHDDNDDCWVSGWGMTDGRVQKLASTLQHVNAPIVSNAKCNDFSVNGWAGRIVDSQICFSTGVTPEGACRGDSGGPLMCKRDGKYHLIGVVSWGTKYCKGKPSIFTRITSYRSWIAKTMQNN